MKDHTELKRLISKRGLASRTQAEQWIREGLVNCNGNLIKDPLSWVPMDSKIEIQGFQKTESQKSVYLLLNKPRGLVTTRRDEKGRPTIYECLTAWSGPMIMPVGRLDQASEGLLLLSNDHQWSNRLMAPESHVTKIYHVQVQGQVQDETLEELASGLEIDGSLTQKSCWKILRTGTKNCWLEVGLCEGRNRQIRKMLSEKGYEVLRLIRVQIGELKLGELPKGHWRELESQEVKDLERLSLINLEFSDKNHPPKG
jgi:23S rRNA pseudouridine2605 synthase